MGGGLKVVSPEIQHKMAAARIRDARATGAQEVVTPCQTCYLGLLNGLEEGSSGLEVHHLNELLVRSVCPEVTHRAVQDMLESRVMK
jgi:Fe-S oxidoreductase